MGLEKSAGNEEIRLSSVKLSGFVVPSMQKLNDGTESFYKLVCSDWIEYYFVPDRKGSEVLKRYKWKEVNVIGLLRSNEPVIIPQKIFPKGPTEEFKNFIDFSDWKRRVGLERIVKGIRDLIPAAAKVKFFKNT